jgi:hypothetical protein
MKEAEQFERFHAALVAFEIRFEQELTEPWEKLETESYSAISNAPITEKFRGVRKFFEDVKTEVARVIHEQFPSLLEIAVANRTLLDDQSPITWTKSQILIQVCNFLGMDELFDEGSEPRSDSRVLSSAEWLTTGDWLVSGRPADTFLLPRWTEVPHPADHLFSSAGARAPHEVELESATLSRVETLQWAKGREFWVRRKIDMQIEIEELDGLIKAAKSSVRAPDLSDADNAPLRRDLTGASESSQNNKFIREGTTWRISFRGEIAEHGMPVFPPDRGQLRSSKSLAESGCSRGAKPANCWTGELLKQLRHGKGTHEFTRVTIDEDLNTLRVERRVDEKTFSED